MTGPEEKSRKLRAVAEDATGFGAGEIRMTRDLVLEPRAVALAQGDPASPYPRSLRYFLTLNGAFLLLVTMIGGFQSQLTAIPEPYIAWSLDVSGKSRDGFLADLDQWFSLATIPILSLCFYVPLAFFFRRWTGNRDAGSGQAFAYLSGWTLYGSVFGLIAVLVPLLRTLAPLGALFILAALFVRMGRHVWWSRPWQALWRFALLAGGMLVAYIPAVILIALVTFGLALFGP